MNVFLVGKEHNQGLRQSDGTPYENIIAYVTFSLPNVDGQVAEKVFLPPRKFPFADLIVGAEYQLDRDYKGNVRIFDLV